MIVKSNRVWITWEVQPRNYSMARELGANLNVLLSKHGRYLKYFLLIPRTISVLIKNRPRVLFVQNPSIVLSVLAVMMRKVFHYYLIIDQHNSGLFPMEGRNKLLMNISRFIINGCDLNIVTNYELAKYVRSVGGKTEIIPDPIPYIKKSMRGYANSLLGKKYGFKFLFICSWSEDEPYDEVLSAFSRLNNENCCLYISGDYRKCLSEVDQLAISDNIILTGFISYDSYIDLLSYVDAVIVLTKRENCMNCGIYEAVSAGKPGIVSSTSAIMNYFYKGFVFSDCNEDSILISMECVINNRESLRGEVRDLKHDLDSKYGEYMKSILSTLQDVECNSE